MVISIPVWCAMIIVPGSYMFGYFNLFRINDMTPFFFRCDSIIQPFHLLSVEQGIEITWLRRSLLCKNYKLLYSLRVTTSVLASIFRN